MSTATAIQKKVSKPMPAPRKKPKKISWKAFQKEYLTREDGYKYEWLNGIVEKTKRTMDYSQAYILINIRNFFDKYKKKHNVSGHLISEIDTFFAAHHRRPDIAYFTDAQIRKAKEGEAPVPQFIIEVISKNDMINTVNKKMEDYRKAGVPVVWHVLPKFKKVHVYHGTEMKIFGEGEKVSAAPVLPDFEMEVSAIFK